MDIASLVQSTDLLRQWTEAHRRALDAEARLLATALRHVRGQGAAPGAVQREHALVLRQAADELRHRVDALRRPH